MSKIYAGVDVSSKKNVAVILDKEGERVGKPLSFKVISQVPPDLLVP